MGFIRDTLLLRQYLRAKALGDLIDDFEESDDKPKKGRKTKRVQQEENTERHLGFWDFLDKQIHSEEEKTQSWKEMLKAVALLILLLIIIVGILLLIDLYQRHVGSTDPIFG